MSTYFEKLRDPRWQIKRLEILTRANGVCEDCGEPKHLHVHHSYYEKWGTDPWNYPNDSLLALCEDCHEWRAAQERNLLSVLARKGWKAGDLFQLVQSLCCLSAKPEEITTLLNLQADLRSEGIDQRLKHIFSEGK